MKPTAIQLAMQGYGWEDIAVKRGMTPGMDLIALRHLVLRRAWQRRRTVTSIRPRAETSTRERNVPITLPTLSILKNK